MDNSAALSNALISILPAVHDILEKKEKARHDSSPEDDPSKHLKPQRLKPLEEFRGSPDDDFDKWYREFTFKIGHINDIATKIEYLKLHLTGSAYLALQVMSPDKASDLIEILAVLRRLFSPTDQRRCRLKIGSIIRQPDEDLALLSARVPETVRGAFPHATGETFEVAVHHFINSLAPELSEKVLRLEPATLEEALRIARYHEESPPKRKKDVLAVLDGAEETTHILKRHGGTQAITLNSLAQHFNNSNKQLLQQMSSLRKEVTGSQLSPISDNAAVNAFREDHQDQTTSKNRPSRKTNYVQYPPKGREGFNDNGRQNDRTRKDFGRVSTGVFNSRYETRTCFAYGRQGHLANVCNDKMNAERPRNNFSWRKEAPKGSLN